MCTIEVLVHVSRYKRGLVTLTSNSICALSMPLPMTLKHLVDHFLDSEYFINPIS